MVNMAHHTTHRCRACGSQSLELVLDLGRVPLANALLRADQLQEVESRFPLALFFCNDCSLVQIGETVPPEILFANYFYASSFSETMLEHVRKLVARLVEERGLTADSKVIEIASNDGYLLQYYKQKGVPVLGIEPAANIAKMAVEQRGIPTLVEFFHEGLAEGLAAEGTRADVVHAHNVFAHVPDPNSFVAGLRHILKPDGVAVIEAPYVKDLVEKLEFDTIYHEHFSYYSATAVQNLCRRHGMRLVRLEWVPIHGGSLRMFIGHESQPADSTVAEMLMAEQQAGMAASAYYHKFADKVWALRDQLLAELNARKERGEHLAAYGASAKGSTLMNAFGIGADQLDFVVDRSSLKQGHYTPGNHLPILAPEALLEKRPDAVLLLTWNFGDEILRQQQPYRDAGGKFIVPIPDVRVV